MKKLLAVVLMATLLFTGCGKQPEKQLELEITAQTICLKGVEWGMTVEEVRNSLNLPGDALSKSELVDVEERNGYWVKNCTFKNQSCDVLFLFSKEDDLFLKGEFLNGIRLGFKSSTLGEEIKEQMTQQWNNPKESTGTENLTQCSWDSPTSVSDYYSNGESFSKFFNEYAKQMNYDTLPQWKESKPEYEKNIAETPICAAALTSNPNAQEGYATILMLGGIFDCNISVYESQNPSQK